MFEKFQDIFLKYGESARFFSTPSPFFGAAIVLIRPMKQADRVSSDNILHYYSRSTTKSKLKKTLEKLIFHRMSISCTFITYYYRHNTLIWRRGSLLTGMKLFTQIIIFCSMRISCLYVKPGWTGKRDLGRRAGHFSYEHSIPVTVLEIFIKRMCETIKYFSVAKIYNSRLGKQARITPYKQNVKFASFSELAR